MEELKAQALEYWEIAVEYLSHPELLFQVGLIVVLFLPAWFLSTRVEPLLEQQARKIRGMPGTLRIVVAFLRRMEWLFFVIFLGVAYVLTSAVGWPEKNYLIYGVMLLAGAWLLISVVSHAIRSRFVGRIFTVIVWVFVAASILGIVDDVATILDGVGFTVGAVRISVLSVLQMLVFVGGLLWIAVHAGDFFDRRVQKVEELTPSLRVLLGKIIRIALVVLAVMVAMQALSIDLTALTVLSGAVGVGIGFGLQKVVSNFISGMIILLDQSIKPGDTITLGETFGWIRELRARFVSVVTRDGREYLIPNEDFITTQVINWSFSDKYVRLDVPFGVSYDADPHQVIDIAIEAAASVDRVVATYRRPVCWMTEFGDSSINFLLRFWIEDPQRGLTNIRGKVMLALWDAFKESGIKIPFPHREVIMKTPVTVTSTEPQS
ncbi:MAG: mechanosensitive ion channel [Gammaproteobacteria bacterium]|nr:mechanosensitive ion channel [Gammaproteobacteria bacterium]MDH3953867.1 mechanosensitive ion channel [Gammaproteobacteria bacterium]MDH4003534.1 mechanosensitive ion channel [Gammaproteobacteria bacterium]